MMLIDKQLMTRKDVSDFFFQCGYFKVDLCKMLAKLHDKPILFNIINQMLDILEKSIEIGRCYEHDLTWFRVNQQFYQFLVERHTQMQSELDALRLELKTLKEEKR